MAITVTNKQGYSKTDQPSQYSIKPSQPQYGDSQANTGGVGSAITFFQYDIITPWGLGRSVSNAAQTARLMVGWGLKVLIGLLCSQDVQLYIFVNSGMNSTFTQIDTSPIALTANAKWQFVTVGPLAAAAIQGRLSATSSNSTVEYHVRLLEQ